VSRECICDGEGWDGCIPTSSGWTGVTVASLITFPLGVTLFGQAVFGLACIELGAGLLMVLGAVIVGLTVIEAGVIGMTEIGRRRRAETHAVVANRHVAPQFVASRRDHIDEAAVADELLARRRIHPAAIDTTSTLTRGVQQ
jgi:hypothetical protein